MTIFVFAIFSSSVHAQSWIADVPRKLFREYDRLVAAKENQGVKVEKCQWSKERTEFLMTIPKSEEILVFRFRDYKHGEPSRWPLKSFRPDRKCLNVNMDIVQRPQTPKLPASVQEEFERYKSTNQSGKLSIYICQKEKEYAFYVGRSQKYGGHRTYFDFEGKKLGTKTYSDVKRGSFNKRHDSFDETGYLCEEIVEDAKS